MSPGQCSCPHCGTPLRIRDRSFVGRQVECPECQVKLVILLDAERKLVAETSKEAPVRKSTAPRLVAPVARAGSTLGRRLSDLVHSPLAIAWALGIGLTAFVAIILLRPAVRFRSPAEKPAPAVADSPKPEVDQKVKPVQVTPEPPAVPVKPPALPIAGTLAEEDADVPSALNVANANPPSPEVPVPAPPAGVVKIKVEELFTQPLKGFSTTRPLSRRELIELVEELLGAPIRYDAEELGEKNLERTMSISLEATTVGGVLKVLLDSAEWEYVVEGDGIRLKPRRVAGK